MGEDRSRTDEILDISVSYDGSWSKRGFTSKIGVGFVVDSYTNLILDFSVMSKFCGVCVNINSKERKGERPKEETARRRNLHKHECSINVEPGKSSGSTEGDISIELFRRSEEKKR